MIFFAMVELLSKSGKPLLIEEGIFINGKRFGLFRVSSVKDNYLGWFKADKKHGKMISVNLNTKMTKRLLYEDGTLKGTFTGNDMTTQF